MSVPLLDRAVRQQALNPRSGTRHTGGGSCLGTSVPGGLRTCSQVLTSMSLSMTIFSGDVHPLVS